MDPLLRSPSHRAVVLAAMAAALHATPAQVLETCCKHPRLVGLDFGIRDTGANVRFLCEAMGRMPARRSWRAPGASRTACPAASAPRMYCFLKHVLGLGPLIEQYVQGNWSRHRGLVAATVAASSGCEDLGGSTRSTWRGSGRWGGGTRGGSSGPQPSGERGGGGEVVPRLVPRPGVLTRCGGGRCWWCGGRRKQGCGRVPLVGVGGMGRGRYRYKHRGRGGGSQGSRTGRRI